MRQPGHLPDNPVTAPDLAATPVKVRCRAPTGTQFSCQATVRPAGRDEALVFRDALVGHVRVRLGGHDG
jgi:hypothetical protein